MLSHLPNILTCCRFLLLIPLIYLLVKQEYLVALVVMTVAGLTDGLDGFLARRFNWISRLGSALDPLADKALLISVYGVLVYSNLIPLGIGILVIGRDLLILLGVVSYWICFRDFTAQPILTSKICTLCEILLGLTIIAQQIFDGIPSLWVVFWLAAVSIFCLLSGSQYAYIWGRKSWQQLYSKIDS